MAGTISKLVFRFGLQEREATSMAGIVVKMTWQLDNDIFRVRPAT
jgi:hypothetical protein